MDETRNVKWEGFQLFLSRLRGLSVPRRSDEGEKTTRVQRKLIGIIQSIYLSYLDIHFNNNWIKLLNPCGQHPALIKPQRPQITRLCLNKRYSWRSKALDACRIKVIQFSLFCSHRKVGTVCRPPPPVSLQLFLGVEQTDRSVINMQGVLGVMQIALLFGNGGNKRSIRRWRWLFGRSYPDE